MMDDQTKDEGSFPELRLNSLKAAIPPACFQPSLPTSLMYLLRDIGYCGLLIYCALQIDRIPLSGARYLAWICYGFFQGCVGVGFWILAHECGHGAFSLYPWVNDIIGYALHSALLVPYFSWKTTHARHHRYTGHMGKDTAFVPFTKEEYENSIPFLSHTAIEYFEDAPAMALLELLIHQLFGWPMYLLFNVSAGVDSLPSQHAGSSRKSHFDPFGALFTQSQRLYILLSDLGLAAFGCILVALYTQVGLQQVLLLYFLPYIWVNHWIVSITYLHHTHPSLPHYGDKSWTFLKGSLSTIYRTTGFLGRHLFHDIIDFHVVHHLFPNIPFYKAEEATRAIRPLLGPLYNEQKEASLIWSLYPTFRFCKFVSNVDSASSGEGPEIFRWNTDKM
ncbi:oleate delta-12 desaturase, partial [Penicillium verhagenii]|uniref:oleate delta-12 desaturase n=1 Tax=Penicillium verhagenii TaxID=1562060 RepID=UPI0025459DF9